MKFTKPDLSTFCYAKFIIFVTNFLKNESRPIVSYRKMLVTA